ncbi:MAG TPA: energy transducer TonB [Pyrinomonadaceae bacterium]|nr:energy transducer TonB [Pyrinomonadaceae bacterium]
MQRRIARARSLAAVGRLAAAASELESLRAASKDESVRDVARVLLMWIFVEMPDYARANALLEETFKERGAEPARVAYHALAGQTINGVRAHLERYRTFGINVADADLPAEAVTDLDQLRVLLERLVEHAKTIRGEEDAKSTAARSTETTALLEDAASVRLRLARNDPERTRWQGEVSEARQRLVASETRIASISSVPFSRPTPAPPTSAPPASAPPTPSASDAPGRGAPAKAADQQKSVAPERAANGSANNSPASSAPAASRNPGQAPGTPAAGERQPVAIGSLHTVARQKSAPSYPSIARAARVSGVVTVYLVVNEKGEVESVTRADGPQQLQNAAADAARRWKFHPTVIDGQPVRVTGYISFNFAL